jgi:hypothetical protein
LCRRQLTRQRRLCGLHLDGRDELLAAQVPESWEINEFDPADFEGGKDEAEKMASGYYDPGE